MNTGALALTIKAWGRELGFGAVGISDVDLSHAEPGLTAWLAGGHHGEMDYMARHGTRRARPAELVPGTVRAICVRLDYPGFDNARRSLSEAILQAPNQAFLSRYALGRDYHKVLRARMQTLATRIEGEIGTFGYRIFTDSAPLMEVELATKAGLGWRGKHTLLLAREAGSNFFLGEILIDVPLPVDVPAGNHCGACRNCIDVCPTQAIIAPYQLDARRCISYLTIELKGSIPVDLRPLIGNRVYGCDDCQLYCPWNKFAQVSNEPDFQVRHGLDDVELTELFAWSEAEFNERLSGSAIRRIGHERWLRNLAVGLGNARRALVDKGFEADATKSRIQQALAGRADDESALVREHVTWAAQCA